jgi:hypothetical protein
MSFEPALVLSFALIMGAVLFTLVRLQRARVARKEDDLRREASGRGWKFQVVSGGGGYRQRWEGTTDFVTWAAEFDNPPRRRNTRSTPRLRWWTETMRGPIAPVLLMGAPGGQELPSFAIGKGEGLLAQLAQKAASMAMGAAVNYYFGDEAGKQVDTGTLRPLENAPLPGFVVMAGDPAEASRMLSSGLRDATAELSRNAHVKSGRTLFSILVLPRRLMLARQADSVTTSDLEHFIRAGVALTRQARQS